jgi:hypothetical protein
VTVAITQKGQQSSKIPTWTGWMQRTTFVVLYILWVLRGVVGIPQTAIAFEVLQGKCADLTQHNSAKSDPIFGRSA